MFVILEVLCIVNLNLENLNYENIFIKLFFGAIVGILLIAFILRPLEFNEAWALLALPISFRGNTYSLFGGFAFTKVHHNIFHEGGNVYSIMGILQVGEENTYSFFGISLFQLANESAHCVFGLNFYQKACSARQFMGISFYQEADEPRQFLSVSFYQNAIGPGADAYLTFCLVFLQVSDMDIENKHSFVFYSKTFWKDNQSKWNKKSFLQNS